MGISVHAVRVYNKNYNFKTAMKKLLGMEVVSKLSYFIMKLECIDRNRRNCLKRSLWSDNFLIDME